jgi:RNA polymerase sigma-70 factor, ECF subfamily
MAVSQDKYVALTQLFCEPQSTPADYASFLKKITPFLRQMVSRKIPMSDVEDVVQEILISIHKARHTYDGSRPLMPWITSIAHFRIIDHLRKYYSQMRHETCDISDYEYSLCDVTEEGGESESIDNLFQHVPEKMQKILTMMHVEGYTAKEIGNHMQMNESAVKVAAHRAVKKIREKCGL